MDIKVKVSIYMAIAAFIIAFVVALLSGLKFGVVIMRSFVAAIVFGGIGYVGVMFLEKNIPELFNQVEKKDEYKKESEVDIVLPTEDVVVDNVVDSNVNMEDLNQNDTFESRKSMDDIFVDKEIEANKANTKSSGNKKLQDKGDYYEYNGKIIPKEPEQIARAVRTMMNKD